jgi:hypothetical protein
MTQKQRSNLTFLILLAILALAAALNSILPQGEIAGLMPSEQVSQIPRWQLMLGGAAITAVL